MSTSQFHQVLDVVNLNADASCLTTEHWLNLLKGGKNSFVYRWLNTYVELEKKVTLGITGATIADIYMNNHDSIELIKSNSHVFEICLRPFAHDIALLRSNEGFLLNLEVGQKTIKSVFGNCNYVDFFLPPEFMLTNTQIYFLEKAGVQGTFINPTRFSLEIKNRLPDKEYFVKGIDGSSLRNIPFNGELTRSFLNGLHYYNASKWNEIIKKKKNNFSWRDGESAFFIPDGVRREKAWLRDESANIKRVFLNDLIKELDFSGKTDNQFESYPVHSFSAWVREFKTMGFIQKVQDVERCLENFSKFEKGVWLQLINSDILSSIEKSSPEIEIQDEPSDKVTSMFTIWRAEKGLEGEELINSFVNKKNTNAPYLSQKISQRLKFLDQLIWED